MALKDASQPYYFFANAKIQRCNIDGLSLFYPKIGDVGSLCAYIADAQRIYACPAPDLRCSSEGLNGTVFEPPAPVDGRSNCQTTNNTGGTVYWQCLSKYDTCNTVRGWSNNCQSVWTSPLSGATADDTAAVAANVVSAQSAQSSVSLPSQTASSTQIPTSTQTVIEASSTQTAIATSSTRQPMAGGTIAGISVGATLAAVALIALAIILWRRSVRRAAQKQISPQYYNSSQFSHPSPSIFSGKHVRTPHPDEQRTEILTQNTYPLFGNPVAELGDGSYHNGNDGNNDQLGTETTGSPRVGVTEYHGSPTARRSSTLRSTDA